MFENKAFLEAQTKDLAMAKNERENARPEDRATVAAGQIADALIQIRHEMAMIRSMMPRK